MRGCQGSIDYIIGEPYQKTKALPEVLTTYRHATNGFENQKFVEV